MQFPVKNPAENANLFAKSKCASIDVAYGDCPKPWWIAIYISVTSEEEIKDWYFEGVSVHDSITSSYVRKKK